MNHVNQTDRNNLAIFHSHASGSGARNLRDASGSTPSTWTQKPTIIATPSNRKATRIPGQNPFSGNPVARKTPHSVPGDTLRPSKRRRVGDSQGHAGMRGSSSRHLNGIANSGRDKSAVFKRPVIGPDDNTGAIVIDSDEEDTGTPLARPGESSPDPLNFMRRSPPPYRTPMADGENTLSRKQKMAEKKSKLPSSSMHGHHPPNGLQSREKEVSDGEDSISYFSEEPSNGRTNRKSPTRMPTPNRTAVPDIKETRKKYEDKQGPRLDLTLIGRRPTIKAAMKTKAAKTLREISPNPVQKDPIATTSDLGRARNPFKPSLEEGRFMLPLRRWSLGVQLLPEDDSDPAAYMLLYEHQRTRLTIRHGRPPHSSIHSEEFSLDRDIDSIEYSDHQKPQNYYIIQMVTTSGKRRRSFQYPDALHFGSRQDDGLLTFRFVDGQDWSLQSYGGLIDYLKKACRDCRSIDKSATKSMWDLVEQTAMSRNPAKARVDTFVKLRNGGNTVVKSLGPPIGVVVEKPPRPQPIPRHKKAMETTELVDPPRRSSRQSERRIPSPSVDPDELILVYPPSGTGAVNITRADLNRLQPGEFLNDTLIEFGLKLWLNDLRERDPELADQIHVFSSFFYKKLNKKSLEEGYQSVRKWTSKFDLFQKKYIIVPINEHLHWYLAIIYHPHHTLSPPPYQEPKPSVSTRGRKRRTEEAIADASLDEPLITSTDIPTSIIDPIGDVDADQPTPPSTQNQEDEVEQLLRFETSCSIGDGGSVSSTSSCNGTTPAGQTPIHIDDYDLDHSHSSRRDDSPMMVPSNMEVDELEDEDGDQLRIYSPSISEVTSANLGFREESDGMDVDGDVVELANINDSAARAFKQTTSAFTSDDGGGEVVLAQETALSGDGENLRHPINKGAVNTKIFYGKEVTRDKRRHPKVSQTGPDAEVASDPENGTDDLPDPPNGGKIEDLTYIFTLDSLGSRHPQATKNLRLYLNMEAKDKKGVENTTPATGKQALVPVQPNYCDCGIYLLHFAKMFMEDPIRCCRIMTARKSNSNIAERQADWDNAKIGTFRQELASRIESFSEDWKKDRAAKEEQKKKEALEGKEQEKAEVSDSDIDIVEDVLPSKELPSKTKGKGKGKANEKEKETGKAQRMRG